MGRFFTTILIASCVGIAASGQVLLKIGMSRIGRIEGAADLVSRQFLVGSITTWQIPAAIALYVIGLVLWMAVLSRESLSFAYPFLALTYLLAVVLDATMLGTHISALRWAGVALVVGGLGLIWSS